MEYGINKYPKTSNIDYIFFIVLLASTSFEFFFRSELVFFIITFLSIIYCLNKIIAATPIIYFSFIIFIICYILQFATIDSYKFTSIISRCIYLFGSYFIACIIYKRFIIIYQNVIYWIALMSLIIYIVCTLIPSIKEYLIYNVAPIFTSLNASTAVQEGGGINILIYNFQTRNVLESVGLMRNCGPFWEPGMYAVFLSMGLFLNLFVNKCSRKQFNLILIISLISTFSTGGYISLLTILLFYILTKHNSIIKLIGILTFIGLTLIIFRLDFIGEKINNQITSAEIGTDVSRFSAILTQFQMIKDSPIIGGMLISDYVDTDETTTLASGLFYVFVQYGIPVGIIFYILLYKSIRKLLSQYNSKKSIHICFFILLLILSISQTIFSNNFFMGLLYAGLLTQPTAITNKIHNINSI